MRRTVAADPSLVATLTTVEQVMSTELIAVDPSANLMEAVGAMSAAGAGPFLLQDGALVGIFTERDILRALGYSSSADLARVSSVSVDVPRSGDDRTRHHGS